MTYSSIPEDEARKPQNKHKKALRTISFQTSPGLSSVTELTNFMIRRAIQTAKAIIIRLRDPAESCSYIPMTTLPMVLYTGSKTAFCQHSARDCSMASSASVPLTACVVLSEQADSRKTAAANIISSFPHFFMSIALII